MRVILRCLTGLLVCLFSLQALAEDDLVWSYDRGVVLEAHDGAAVFGAHVELAPSFSLSSIKEPTERITAYEMNLDRVRLRLEGRPRSSTLAYALSFSADEGRLALLDAWLDVSLGHPAIGLRAGRMKRPFSQQGLIPYRRMVMPDRPLTESVFRSERDVGAMFHGPDVGVFEWALGAFLGEYDSPSTVGKRMRREVLSEEEAGERAGSFVFRLARRPNMGSLVDESDGFKLPFRWSVGLSGQAFLGSKDGLESALQGAVDLRIAARGFMLSGAFFVATEQDGDAFTNQTFESAGYTLQTSYRIGTTVEPSIRFTHLVFGQPSSDVKDVSVGCEVTFQRGLVRWLNRVGMTKRDIDGGYRSDVSFISQLALSY
jgi:hypothetical protein